MMTRPQTARSRFHWWRPRGRDCSWISGRTWSSARASAGSARGASIARGSLRQSQPSPAGTSPRPPRASNGFWREARASTRRRADRRLASCPALHAVATVCGQSCMHDVAMAMCLALAPRWRSPSDLIRCTTRRMLRSGRVSGSVRADRAITSPASTFVVTAYSGFAFGFVVAFDIAYDYNPSATPTRR